VYVKGKFTSPAVPAQVRVTENVDERLVLRLEWQGPDLRVTFKDGSVHLFTDAQVQVVVTPALGEPVNLCFEPVALASGAR